MKNCLDFNIRCGKHVNLVEELNAIEEEYKNDILATIDAFTTYEEVQAETYNDEVTCRTKILTFNHLGYLDDEETSGICEKIAKIRIDLLDEKLGGDSNEE